MTDLTEQWQKGKLPFGYYYVKFLNGKKGVKKLGEYAYRKLIGEVIDIVPTYDCVQMLKVTLDNVARHRDKYKSDCHTLAQKLLQVKPELRDWLEVNFKEYL